MMAMITKMSPKMFENGLSEIDAQMLLKNSGLPKSALIAKNSHMNKYPPSDDKMPKIHALNTVLKYSLRMLSNLYIL